VATLPPPARFQPYSRALSATPLSRSLTTRESPIVGGDELEEEISDSFEPFVPDQALLRDDESLGELDIIFKRY
jgi:hypothetical protein